MNIEQEVNQARFRDIYEKLGVNILFTGSWLHQKNAGWLKPLGITPEQYNVLRILRGARPQPLMLSEIAARMIDKSSNCTRLVEKLRLKGLLKREICSENRRQVDIVITDKGMQLLDKVDRQRDEWLATLKRLSRKEAAVLNELLDKLRN